MRPFSIRPEAINLKWLTSLLQDSGKAGSSNVIGVECALISEGLMTDYRINALQGVGSGIFAGYVPKRNERGHKLYLKIAHGACAQPADLDSFKALASW